MGESDVSDVSVKFDGFERDLKRARKTIEYEIWRVREIFKLFTLDDFVSYLDPHKFEENLDLEGEYTYHGGWFSAEIGVSAMNSYFLRIKAIEIPRIKRRYSDDQRIEQLYERIKAAQ